MAGRGPAPKDPSRRARTNGPASPLRILDLVPSGVQPLPDDLLVEGESWHPATVRWWDRWCESPVTDNWTGTQWSFLEETVVLHHEYMKKRTFTLGSELRLREGRMGAATEEDMNRLRISRADADEKDEKRAQQGSSARARRGALKAAEDAVEAG